MPLVENQELVQVLLANRPDPSFGNSVGVRRLVGCPDAGHPHRREHRIEGWHEFSIAIVDQEVRGLVLIRDGPTHVSRLLGDP